MYNICTSNLNVLATCENKIGSIKNIWYFNNRGNRLKMRMRYTEIAQNNHLQIQMYLTSKKKWIERIGGKSSFNGEFRIYIPVVKHLQIFIVSNVEYTKKLASLFKWKLYKCKMVNCKMHKIFRFTLLKQSAVLCWRTEHYELQAWNILTFSWWVCLQ